MIAWFRTTAALTAALSLIALPLAGHVSDDAARAQAATAPAVTIEVPTVSGTCRPAQPCLRGTVALSATAAATDGRVIVAVQFQRSRAGAGEWRTIESDVALPYGAPFDTLLVPDGLYDLRAVAVDSAGETAISATSADRLVANRFRPVQLDDPGSPLKGTVSLRATTQSALSGGASVVFQRSAARADVWTTIATTVSQEPGSPPSFRMPLDTAAVPDGLYDLRAAIQNADGTITPAIPRRVRTIDNGTPDGQFTVPPPPLAGIVTLRATAEDAASGVAAVRFQRAPEGSGRWSSIGVRTRLPYALSFDTRGLADGRYDLRVVVSDRAGNQAASTPAAAVEVRNPGQLPLVGLSIDNLAALADDVRLLGAVAGSAQNETWGFGVTSAPPAAVDGVPLPYTALGEQPVLLRYADAGGWQVADVLRNRDGSAFPVREAGDSAAPQLKGQMTPSGEAWLALTRFPSNGGRTVSLFHRLPGGRFVHDPAASAALGDLTAQGVGDLRLAQTAEGRAYGIVVAPDQSARQVLVSRPGSPDVVVDGRLDYGVLLDGAWTRWTAELPADYAPAAGDAIRLRSADLTAPGAGWAALEAEGTGPAPLMLARFQGDTWTYLKSGLDALDLTNRFDAAQIHVLAVGLRAAGDSVWVGARLTPAPSGSDGGVIARFDGTTGVVTNSWCAPLMRESVGCAEPLGAAAVPDAIFATPDGPLALALPPASSTRKGFVHVFARGQWTRVAAPGFLGGEARALFTSPQGGWLSGENALGQIRPTPPPDPLALWPQPNRLPLLAVAAPPSSGAAAASSGALAVGVGGTALRYDASTGWLLETVPQRARRLALRGVAFVDGTIAFAVGQGGTILRWNGTAWSEDPQSVSLTQSELNAVAFASSGEGWAVGRYGTILRYDGASWGEEPPPPEDSGVNITSVAVAGSDVFALAGGNLITRDAGGTWRRVADVALPDDPALPGGNLRVVSGLPDGGAVVAGRAVVLVRQRAGQPFRYADQPIEGIAVAVSAFRDPGGDVRAFVSSAPPVLQTRDVGGFPPGDGVLLRQTAAGWEDLSRAQYPGGFSGAPGDGVVKADPVLGIAPSPTGDRAWVVGGYAGTLTAAGFGTNLPFAARPGNWQTSSIWRWDLGGSVPSPNLSQETIELPAQPDTVRFAYFSSPVCRVECAETIDAQPDVNLRAAAKQIAAFGAQPGGPVFAMLGGNARGRSELDFAKLPGVLAPIAPVPLLAAHGPLDALSGEASQPWAEAFSRAPAPFGPAPAPAGITPVDAHAETGSVHRYYAFDAAQNGGRLRVIVLDNAAGSLEASSPGQTAWLQQTLAAARFENRPVVVVVAQALRQGGATDGREVATLLANGGVLAVFTTSAGPPGGTQLNERWPVPENAELGQPTIPEYEGASLGYQEIANNGVLWYSVAVNTSTRTVIVDAVPVIDTLALKPLVGLSVARSSTLAFEAVGRRPRGTLPQTAGTSTTGIDNYVSIPAPSCGTRPCLRPSYFFTSSDPTIGDFVQPSGAGSRFPKLDATGKPIASPTSGLFCAYNTGSTTVSLTTGLLKASLPVTVAAGDIGRPCGTVFRAGVGRVVVVPSRSSTVRQRTRPGGAGAPPPPPADEPPLQTETPDVALPAPPPPPPPLAPVAQPKPGEPKSDKPPPRPVSPVVPATPAPPAAVPPPAPVPPSPVVAVPPLPPAVQPIPPGGASSAQAVARRKEKAVKHASQSAYTIRPAGIAGTDWFYPGLGVVSVLAMLLVAGGMRPGPRQRPAPALARAPRGFQRGLR